jgi:serine/threonine protein kinase
MAGTMSALLETQSPDMSAPVAALTPKSQLLGKTLDSGWTLVEQFAPEKHSTGGNFGVGYKATRGNEIAFVKAVDFVAAVRAPDPLMALQSLVAEATFEKDVLAFCADQKMSRVLKFLGHEYFNPGNPADMHNRVSCLIMELGSDDLRGMVYKSPVRTFTWNLQIMRDVAQALAQLHKGGIAHQDIKPSNVISVDGATRVATEQVKVGDLGRVVWRDQPGPFNALPWPGDGRYAPPERWYGYMPPDWTDAREASDAYMLGSLLLFLCTGASLQILVFQNIPNSFKPGVWMGAFDQDLLAVLQDAHDKVLANHLMPTVPAPLQDELMAHAKALTNPNPLLRGDPRARRQLGRPVGIDRLHQKFMALAAKSAAIDRGRQAP